MFTQLIKIVQYIYNLLQISNNVLHVCVLVREREMYIQHFTNASSIPIADIVFSPGQFFALKKSGFAIRKNKTKKKSKNMCQ